MFLSFGTRIRTQMIYPTGLMSQQGRTRRTLKGGLIILALTIRLSFLEKLAPFTDCDDYKFSVSRGFGSPTHFYDVLLTLFIKKAKKFLLR